MDREPSGSCFTSGRSGRQSGGRETPGVSTSSIRVSGRSWVAKSRQSSAMDESDWPSPAISNLNPAMQKRQPIFGQPPEHSGGGGLQRQGLNEQVASATNSCSQRISGAVYGSGMEPSSLPGDDSRRSTSLASSIRRANQRRTADRQDRRQRASPAWWFDPAKASPALGSRGRSASRPLR